MVYWNDKERGYPISAAETTKGVQIHCTACKHSVTLLWPDVMKRWRPGTYTRDMAASLRCTQCGVRQACVMAWAWGPCERDAV